MDSLNHCRGTSALFCTTGRLLCANTGWSEPASMVRTATTSTLRTSAYQGRRQERKQGVLVKAKAQSLATSSTWESASLGRSATTYTRCRRWSICLVTKVHSSHMIMMKRLFVLRTTLNWNHWKMERCVAENYGLVYICIFNFAI